MRQTAGAPKRCCPYKARLRGTAALQGLAKRYHAYKARLRGTAALQGAPWQLSNFGNS